MFLKKCPARFFEKFEIARVVDMTVAVKMVIADADVHQFRLKG